MAKNHRWVALAATFLWVILAVAGSISPVTGAAADLGDTARLISGAYADAARSGAAEGPWHSYAQEVSTYWREYDHRIGRPLRQWACKELDRSEGVTVFYPFSGPDLPWAYQLFPEADRYVLVAMEKAEAPPLMQVESGHFHACWYPVEAGEVEVEVVTRSDTAAPAVVQAEQAS